MIKDSKDSYPRMLYKPDGGNEIIWGYYLGTNIVNSKVEEVNATKDGWLLDPTVALKQAKRKEKLHNIALFFKGHWQFWLMFLVGVAGIIASLAR